LVLVKLLFIHEVNYLSKVVYEMHEFPELLAARGHEVSFLHFPEGEPGTTFRTKRETIAGRVHKDVRLTLITPPTVHGSVGRYLAPLMHLPSLRREIQRGHYDAIVLYAVPTTGWQTIALANRRSVPVLFRALDISHQIRATPVTPLIQAAERYVYRNATLLSGNTPAMVEYCTTMSGRTAPTAVHVPPLDLAHFAVESDGTLRSQFDIPADGRVVLFMGTFFPFAGLEVLIDSMAPFLIEDANLFLVLVGGGELDDRLRQRVADLSLKGRVIFTGVVPYRDLPTYLADADVAVNPFERESLTDVALPHKVLQYMAAGVPVVSTALRGLRGVLGEESGVTWVAAPSEVAEAAVALAGETRLHRQEVASKQRDLVMRLFDADAATGALEESLRRLL
jgi:glycosyltransferase involved in cell wall biosynthesis